MNHGDLPSIANARLPDNYVAAVEALRLCAKHFTPERYVRAAMALDACLDVDEASGWAQDRDTMASYGRVADDDTLDRLIRRIAKKRAVWKLAQDVG